MPEPRTGEAPDRSGSIVTAAAWAGQASTRTIRAAAKRSAPLSHGHRGAGRLSPVAATLAADRMESAWRTRSISTRTYRCVLAAQASARSIGDKPSRRVEARSRSDGARERRRADALRTFPYASRTCTDSRHKNVAASLAATVRLLRKSPPPLKNETRWPMVTRGLLSVLCSPFGQLVHATHPDHCCYQENATQIQSTSSVTAAGVVAKPAGITSGSSTASGASSGAVAADAGSHATDGTSGASSSSSRSSARASGVTSSASTSSAAGASSTNSGTIDKIKALIRTLEAQLAAVLKNGNDPSGNSAPVVSASNSRANPKGADQAGKTTMPNASLNTANELQAAIQTAQAELAQLMVSSGQTTGLVSATG